MDVTFGQCLHCGGAFEPRRNGGKPQRYCSASCRIAANRHIATERARPRLLRIKCAECGREVEVSSKGTPRQFCSRTCSTRASNRRARRALPPLANPTVKACAHCGAEFAGKSRDRIYCYNERCKQAAYQRRRAQGTQLVKPRLVKCDGCGEPFESVRPEARWCSKRCANRHWGNVRARQRPRPSEARYTDLQIFERDAWCCHVCREQVRRDVPRLHPEGATIDHLIPIAKGGLDEPMNVATAHWKCNRENGTRLATTLLPI